MKIDELRVYAEVLEQGLDFKDYLIRTSFKGPIKIIYSKKGRSNITSDDSLISRLRKSKDIDVLITAISGGDEFPILMVEYSTAVPTDDHKMQRSDLYYWSSIYQIAVMKISPTDKGMNQSFGGGSRFDDQLEMKITYKMGGVIYLINWETVDGTELLDIKPGYLSCINYSDKIMSILSSCLELFGDADNFNDYFKSLRIDFWNINETILKDYMDLDPRKVIVDSTRFRWEGSKLISKINRFGHAMDPDRGVMYFTNMLVGLENCITEIQVNRSSSIHDRGGYHSLFDATSNYDFMIDFVKNIINTKNNVFSSEDALFVFSKSLNIDGWDLFSQISANKFVIKDTKLADFLQNNTSTTSKSIFFLSTELILTDINRNIICSITWSHDVVEKYLRTLNGSVYTITNTKPLSFADAKEDIVTYASVQLYKKIGLELLAVSYPGAQGDRCVLVGQGRTVLRTYVDVIGYHESDYSATVFLQESKDKISKSKADVIKLNRFINDKTMKDGLFTFIKKIKDIDFLGDIKISIGSKIERIVPNYNVDYIFMFDIDKNYKFGTKISYNIAVIDITLLKYFDPLLNPAKKLRGELLMEQIYTIDE